MSIPNYYRPVYSEKDREKYNLFTDMQTRYKAMAKQYTPTTVATTAYDASKLDNLGVDPNALQDIQDQIENQAAYAKDALEKAQANKDARDATHMDDDEDGSWLAMIFQIIPIGINVLRKGPVIARGFGEMIEGFILLVKNLAITTVILFRDSFAFTGHAFYYVFTLLLCSVFNLLNLHKCILFYLFDLFLYSLRMLLISLLFVIDVFFNVKSHMGISAVECFYLAMELVGYADDFIYEVTEIHVLTYPDFIMNLCYRCALMGDTKKFEEARDNLGYDINIRVPETIGNPIGLIQKGISDVFSFFKL